MATATATSQTESTLQDPPIGPQAITNLTTVESNTIEPMSHNNSTPVSMAIGIEPNDISTWSVLQKRMSLDCQFMHPAEIPAAFIVNNSRQTSTQNTQKLSFNSDASDSRPNTITQSKIEQIVDQKISSLKVYVLESDITEAQKAVNSFVELASFLHTLYASFLYPIYHPYPLKLLPNMTIYEKKLSSQLLQRYPQITPEEMIAKLIAIGVVDATRCKVLSVSEYVNSLLLQGYKKIDA